MMPRLFVALCALAISGCVSHRAQVVPSIGVPCSAAIGTRVLEPFSAPADEQGSLPRSVPVTAWSRDDEGRLSRDDLLLETPLPWWQRFPVDALTDVAWPHDLEASCSATPHLVPVPASDPIVLTTNARAAGYAAPAKADHP